MKRCLMKRCLMKRCLLLAPWIAIVMGVGWGQSSQRGIDRIENIVVIFAENRSFDALYGSFPGADGLQQAKSAPPQRDRHGSTFRELPPIWQGLTAAGVTPVITEADTGHLPNQPFAIDDPHGFNQSAGVITRDLWHRFYENQMQIDGGKNDGFVAWADSGAMVMGHYDGSKMKMWKIAREYTLADHFFMGAFGGSYLNHIWLICACVPTYPNADHSPAKRLISAVEPDGVTLKVAANSPKSAMDGPPKFVNDSNLTPDYYAVNTMQPPYQPSSNKPAPGEDPAFANPQNPTTLPPQTSKTIGDLLSAKGVSWAWYAGAWQAALDGKNAKPVPNFQYHHQPFNYFASMAPGTPERAKHLKDGGLSGAAFIKAIDQGALEHVVFYKPQGNLNEHAGYADVESGDAAYRRCDRASSEEPTVETHGRDRDLRRKRRLLGSRRPAQSRPLGTRLAHSRHHRLALRQERLRRPHALRHHVDPASHHPPFRASRAPRHRRARPGSSSQRGLALGRLNRRSNPPRVGQVPDLPAF